jgi:hypothetical protein
MLRKLTIVMPGDENAEQNNKIRLAVKIFGNNPSESKSNS